MAGYLRLDHATYTRLLALTLERDACTWPQPLRGATPDALNTLRLNESIATGVTFCDPLMIPAPLQYKPVVVQRFTGYVLAGNGTFTMATEELGWPVIDAYFVDVTDAQALLILTADKRYAERSGYHEDALAALLSEIAEQHGDLAGSGYRR